MKNITEGWTLSRICNSARSLVLVAVVFAICLPAQAATTLTATDLLGGAYWDSDDLGIAGLTVTLSLLAEETPHSQLNIFYFDTQPDGWSAAGNVFGSSTNDTVIFPASDSPGDTWTGYVGTDWCLSLLNDTDADNKLSSNDAYLNSDSSVNYAPSYQAQYVKYYLADPNEAYYFGSTSLGDGFIAFVFIDDDHTGPNFDYNDMILGIPVPEPASLLAIAVGGVALLFRRRRSAL